MGYDERRGRWDGGRHGGRDRDRGHHRGGDRDRGEDFQEKRIIDTIVHLVSERVASIVDERQGGSARHDNGGGEKHIVDLIVRLVSEHVRDIVRSELERRFGAEGQPASEERPRGGSPEREPI
jgi:hypothetical protein